ncbi:hypothetical protein VARIO8X_60479 [Burkholderiales bacterium 8X]|nr:hypothetical protein VARIO8X_60479 [Burkholderiales bacterium 8X]
MRRLRCPLEDAVISLVLAYLFNLSVLLLKRLIVWESKPIVGERLGIRLLATLRCTATRIAGGLPWPPRCLHGKPRQRLRVHAVCRSPLPAPSLDRSAARCSYRRSKRTKP